MKNQVEPKVDGAFQDAKGSIGQDMGSVSTGGDRDNVASDYEQHAGSIDSMTAGAGIKQGVNSSVGNLVSENRAAHQNAQQEITHQGDDVKKQHADLENTHKTEANKFTERYNKETDSQVNNPLSHVTERFKQKAEDATKKMDD